MTKDDITPPRPDWSEERGGRIDPVRYPKESGCIDAGERIDEAIAESFPASDPPSFNAGIDDDRPDCPPAPDRN